MKISPEDDIWVIEEFILACRDGLFIDYDGYGKYIDDDDNVIENHIKPSELNKIDHKYKRMVWYNR